MNPTDQIDAIHVLGTLSRGVTVRFVRHDEAHWIWRALLWVVRKRWVTVDDTIFYPDHVESYSYQTTEAQQLHWLNRRLEVVAHEFVHVEQWHRFGWSLFLLIYFGVPLPVFFAGRYFLERQAFLVQIRHFGLTPRQAVSALCGRNYIWCWPRPWALAWFEKNR